MKEWFVDVLGENGEVYFENWVFIKFFDFRVFLDSEFYYEIERLVFVFGIWYFGILIFVYLLSEMIFCF